MTSCSANTLDLFILGTNSSVFHKAWNGSSWHPPTVEWYSLGGTFIYEPVALCLNSSGSERIDVFAIGTDSALYHKWGQSWDGTQWQWQPDANTWENLGGSWQERPSVISTQADRIDVFLIGSGHELYQTFWDGTSWNSDFINLGGTQVHPLSLSTWAPGGIDFWVTEDNSSVYRTYWFNGTFVSDWQNLNSPPVVRQPKGIRWGPDLNVGIDIYVVGQDSSLWHVYNHDAGAWPAWDNQGGQLRANNIPEVVSWGPDRFDVFVVGQDSSVYHKWYDSNNGWGPSGSTSFENLGGTTVRDITAVSRGPGQIDLFIIGTAGDVLYKSYSQSTGWSNYQSLGGVAISSVARSS